MGLFDFLKPKNKGRHRVIVRSGVSINGRSSSKVIFDEVVNPSNIGDLTQEWDVLQDYEIRNNSFKSLEDACARKVKFEGILAKERRNGFAIKGGSNLYNLTRADKLAINNFDLLVEPILKGVGSKKLDKSINEIATTFRSFNRKNKSQISIGYARWYFEYATILFDIENQFKTK